MNDRGLPLPIVALLGWLAALFAVWVAMSITDNAYSRAVSAIEKCEASLPRDKHCVVIAVPKE